MKGQFGPAGALFDGWETRRHNPDHDWSVIRAQGSPGGNGTSADILRPMALDPC
jgi:allantoicase